MVAPSGPSCAVDEIGSLEQDHDLTQILFRNFLSSGDLLNLHGLIAFIILNQVGHRQKTVISFGSNFHCEFNVYTV